MWLLAMYMTGGDIVLGDALPQLNAAGLDCLRRTLAPLAGPACAANLFRPEGQTAPRFVSSTADAYWVACFNLTDTQVVHDLGSVVAARGYQATEFWPQSIMTLPVTGTLTVPARLAMGLQFT